ncbi:MAG: hypothetical protein PWP28_1361 [Oceanotoga sp.]|jgi:hypothetical protein|uniref:Fibronectin type-III domain-containing protein n=1 Tax=Oceanotoga teriensis TaxID=515440 RepID=A0AA45HJ18_9BACT|nr:MULTISPECIES: hypothetical protein [Oceanotoga]MDN5342486.1 hypothetical protein [Oceanotoga sp.]PWJ95618.1 hypothetical protein C7380_10432 [Oceanotoga teriensis]
MKKLLIPLIVLLILLVGCTKTPTNGQDMSGLRIQVSNDFISDGEMGVPVNREISWNSTEVDKYQVMLKEGNETFKIIEETKAKTYALELKEATKYQLKIIALKDDKKVETDTVEFFTEGTFTALEETNIMKSINSKFSSGYVRMPWFLEDKMFFIHTSGGYNLYVIQKNSDESWTSPLKLPSEINEDGKNIISPAVIKNGENYNIYFLKNNESTKYDVYIAEYNFENNKVLSIEKIDSLSSSNEEWDIWVNENEDEVYLTSYGPFSGVDSGNRRSVWKGIKENNNWKVSLNEELNTAYTKTIRNIFKINDNKFIMDDSDIFVVYKTNEVFSAYKIPLNITDKNERESFYMNDKLYFVSSASGAYSIYSVQF